MPLWSCPLPPWLPCASLLRRSAHIPPSCAPPPRSDALLGEVQREADNGRLLRLLFKLNYICERPELGGDSQWSETGDRWGWGCLGRGLFWGRAAARVAASAAHSCLQL